jgi:hypothetical protein
MTNKALSLSLSLSFDLARLAHDRARSEFTKAYAIYGKDSPQCWHAEADFAKAREELYLARQAYINLERRGPKRADGSRP